jgi:TRAP-type mannitol/chloroaromatic compound transport system substrate-binding protein
MQKRGIRSTFIAAAAAMAALLAGAGGAAAQSPTVLKFQAAFPPSSMIYESFQLFAKRVETMSGGRLKIEPLPAGAIVPAFEVLDATHKNVIDGAHSATAYWVGKHRAGTLFGPAPGGPFGMDVLDYMGWVHEGGGLELYREYFQDVLKRNVVPMPLTPVSGQVVGWFKKPFNTVEDLKGRKCRQTGITAEVFTRLGMSTVNMPGGEIVPAGERGLIDCAEWVGPAEDMKMGFQSVWKYYYMPSAHEPATVLELLINGDVWKKLPPDLQEIVRSATWEVTFRYQTILNRANADALKELRERHGVTISRTPDEVLKKILESWDAIAKEEADKDPFFRKVLDSQRRYAGMVVPARRFVYPPYEFTANHYWPEEKK